MQDVIAANSSRHVLTPFHGSGFFASHYLIPLSMFPITIELTLCDPSVVAMTAANGGTNVYSQTYQISNPRILADMVNVDSSIQAQLSSALLEGRALPLTFNTWNNTYYSVAPGASWSININRGFSRLNSMILTHSNAATISGNNNGTLPATRSSAGMGPEPTTSPTTPSGCRRPSGPCSSQRRPCSATAECAYQLSKLLAHHSSWRACPSPRAGTTMTNSLLVWTARGMSSSPGSGMAMMTGLNTKTGNDMIRCTWDNITAQNGWAPDRVWLSLGYQVVVELRAEGVIQLD